MRIKLILLALSAIVISCKQPSTQPPIDGSITGYVVLYNSNGDSIKSLMGTSVWITETSQHTSTDSTGLWSLPNVDAGIYHILFTRPGFDTTQSDEIRFGGVGVYFADRVKVLQECTDSVYLDYAVDSVIGGKHIIFVEGHTPIVAPRNWALWASVDTIDRLCDQTGPINHFDNGRFSISLQEVENSSGHTFTYATGEKVYLRAELLPYGFDGNNEIVGHAPDFSNTLEVSIK